MKKRFDLYNSLEDEWYYLEDMRRDANSLPFGDYIAIGSLGLWNGRVSGYKEFQSADEMFYSDGYDVCWYVENGNLKATEYHHDGSNYLIYRKWKADLSWTQKDNFIEKIMNGTYTQKDVSRYTVSVVPELEKAGII